MKKTIISIATLALIGLSNHGAKAQVCFSPASGSPFAEAMNSKPQSVTSADFNNDGKLDLATANFGLNTVSVLLGTGTGSFGAVNTFTTLPLGSYPMSICSADFNGDSFKDLAVVASGTDDVYIFLGTGTGNFTSGTVLTAAMSGLGSSINSVISADFNADGKADLATANSGSNNVSVLKGTGSGLFNAATNFAVGTIPESVISADFNNDGILDLATANRSSYDISILLGNGIAGFGAASSISLSGVPTSVTSADFNNDGKLDLVANNTSASNVLVSLNTSTSTVTVSFGIPNTYTITGPPAASIISADFNGDGKPDLATANKGVYPTFGNIISVLQGDGTGSFGASIDFAVGTEPASIISADFNGDGKPDLATANFSSSEISVLLNGFSMSATASPSIICTGSTATLTATGATTYTWSANAGSANTAAVSVSPTSNTNYTVTGSNGTCTNTATSTSTVMVNALPMVTVNSGAICTGNSFTMSPSGASTYTFSSGSAVVTPTINTSYTVTGTDVNSCTNTAISTETVNALPAVNAVSDSISLCVGNTATLTASGASTYTWSTSATTTTIAVTPTVTTTYTLSGTDVNGCTNMATVTQTVITCSMGIERIANSNEVSIYPNPASQLVNLKISQFDNSNTNNVEIYNMIGDCVHRQMITSSNCQIDVSNLAEGIYNVTISSNEGVVNKRLVIVR
ncbi:MAG: FG-GAP-like repeat-containing protein [Bacteroidia bacterium]